MSVNVELEFQPFKRTSIKTTPAMNLREIVNLSCAKFGITETEKYSLRQGKTVLDLSLSIRFANLAPGAKLVLVQSTLAPIASFVSIALQLDDGSRHIDKYKPDTRLWEILLHTEKTQELF